jgi:BT4734-like, N-terminal domain
MNLKRFRNPRAIQNILDRSVSMVKSATDTETKNVPLGKVLCGIEGGCWRPKISPIRKKFKETLEKTGDPKQAKKAIAPLKRKLPAIMWSGTFSRRDNGAIIAHSGVICADLDSLGGKNGSVRKTLSNSPHVLTVLTSPSGDGLKPLFRVRADVASHGDSFRAIKQHVLELTGLHIDEKCKDPARLCFVTVQRPLHINKNAVEITPLPPEPKPERPAHIDGNTADLPLRQRIATEKLGKLEWSPEKNGFFCKCPGVTAHTNNTGAKDTIFYPEGIPGKTTAPTLFCQHGSCANIVAAFNTQLRSQIGKAEYEEKTRSLDTPEGKKITERLEKELPLVRLPGDGYLASKFSTQCGKVLQKHGIYQRGGIPVIVNGKCNGLMMIPPAMMRTLAEDYFIPYKVRERVRIVRTMSQTDAEAVLSSPQFVKRLPVVIRIATTRLPVMRVNGAIELLPDGYDRESRTLTLSQCDYDTGMSLEDARATIDDYLNEFPFKDEGRSKAVAIATMEGLYANALLSKETVRPVTICTANAEGAGKTLLIKCTITPAHGLAETDGSLKDEAETEKKLLAIVIEGRPYLFFDNCKGHIELGPLEAFVNAPVWRGRILGTNKHYQGENLVTVLITGNAATVSPDMRRRSLFIELFMEEEKAEDRKFKRVMDDKTLLEWRPRILAALWAFVREWNKAGRPLPSRSHSAFPRWAEVIGGIVEHAGYDCPLATAKIEAAADVDTNDMRELTNAIAEHQKDYKEPVTFSVIVSLAREHGLFERILCGLELGEKLKPTERSKLGKLLRRYDGRNFPAGKFILEGRGDSRIYRVIASRKTT